MLRKGLMALVAVGALGLFALPAAAYDWLMWGNSRQYTPPAIGYYYAPPVYSYPAPAYRFSGYEGTYAPAYVPNSVPARAFYAAEEEPPVQLDRAALVTVHVPNGAQVWLSGEKTHQTGATRDYLTPELTPGQKYYYRVRAVWEADGRMHDETQKVTVGAGQHVTLDFPPAGDGSVAHSR